MVLQSVCIYYLCSTESPGDYFRVVLATLPFVACDRRSCLNLTIVNDLILENTEQFTLSLTRSADLDQRIFLDPVDAIVDIIDNDGTPTIANILHFSLHLLTIV